MDDCWPFILNQQEANHRQENPIRFTHSPSLYHDVNPSLALYPAVSTTPARLRAMPIILELHCMSALLPRGMVKLAVFGKQVHSPIEGSFSQSRPFLHCGIAKQVQWKYLMARKVSYRKCSVNCMGLNFRGRIIRILSCSTRAAPPSARAVDRYLDNWYLASSSILKAPRNSDLPL